MPFRLGFMKKAPPVGSVLTVKMDRPVKRSVVHTQQSAGAMRCVDLLQGGNSKEISMDVGMLWWIV